jgi:hypothetical protein
MEHAIKKSTGTIDASLSVMALITVLVLAFAVYFAVHAAGPNRPFPVHLALVDLPGVGEHASHRDPAIVKWMAEQRLEI